VLLAQLVALEAATHESAEPAISQPASAQPRLRS
jgi:hypothetical protein